MTLDIVSTEREVGASKKHSKRHNENDHLIINIMTHLEKLKQAMDEASVAHARLQAPADAAYKKYAEAERAYNTAKLYEEVRLSVLRELIKQTKYGRLVE